MGRVTTKQVQYRLDSINNIFERHGKNTSWHRSGDESGHSIQAGPADGYPGAKTIIYGEKLRTIYEGLGIALEAMSVIENEPWKSAEEREREREIREKA